MDGVRATWSLISSGYKVFKKVKALRKAVKDAPEKLQSLEDTCILLEQLLENLQRAKTRLPASINAQILSRLSSRVQRGLDEVEKIVDKVTSGCLNEDQGVSGHRISRVKWIWYKEDLDGIERELIGLRDVLCASMQPFMFEILVAAKTTSESDGISPMMSDSSSISRHRAIQHHDSTAIADSGADRYDTTLSGIVVAAASSPPRSSSPPRCPPQCRCRCHYPSVCRLLPDWLSFYVGQVSISKRLLHPTFSPWSLCNLPTCRGDFQRAVIVQWILPFQIFHGFLESSKECQIHFSIGAPRIVPYFPFVDAVYNGDLQSVRNLFAAGKASIWDYTADGAPVFWCACHRWQTHPNEERLEIIRFFIEAGAEALLFEEAEMSHSAHDFLTVGLFASMLGKTSDKTLATTLRTNSTAINVFLSLFNIDPMDALEDCLDRRQSQRMDFSHFVSLLESTAYNSSSHSLVFKMMGYTPLEYAIYFSPESVGSLLANGEDAAAEPTLTYAAGQGMFKLIKPLLDARTDVNTRDSLGYTALLKACSLGYYNFFFELLRWAEDDVNWDARAADGHNALELFDLGLLARAGHAAYLSRSQIVEFRAALVARMDVSDGQPQVPGAFPDA